MTCAQVLASLQAAGSEKTATLYRQHGAGDKIFGASFGAIEKLRREIKRDHALACELWKTGYFEARYLAAQVADPARFTSLQLDTWLKGLSNHTLVDCFVSHIASKSVHAEAKLREWIASPDEHTARAAWHIVLHQAMRDSDKPDFYFLQLLKPIEKHIHAAPNRTREAMNQALIAIGSRSHFLAPYALSTATRIGVVHVDHGATNCVTPDAFTYIQKARARKQDLKKRLASREAIRELGTVPKVQSKRAAS